MQNPLSLYLRLLLIHEDHPDLKTIMASKCPRLSGLSTLVHYRLIITNDFEQSITTMAKKSEGGMWTPTLHIHRLNTERHKDKSSRPSSAARGLR